jgi:biotin operon repressor
MARFIPSKFITQKPTHESSSANDKLTVNEFAKLLKKLERLANATKVGPWTRRVLVTIQVNPHVAAAELAAKLGLDKEWLKLNIRKLKNLGLKISHEPGYELSPRGRAVLKRIMRGGLDLKSVNLRFGMLAPGGQNFGASRTLRLV